MFLYDPIGHHDEFLKALNFICWVGLAHHHAKFSRNWSIHSKDIAIFQIFKMAAAAILDFWNRKILLTNGVQRLETHQHAKFRQNRLISREDIKIFRYFKMVLSAILDLFGAYLDHPQWVHGGLYHYAKFGYDRCSSFYDMNISIFGTLAGKCLFTPQNWVFGQFDPLHGLQYESMPTKAHPCVTLHPLSHQPWKCGERSDL